VAGDPDSEDGPMSDTILLCYDGSDDAKHAIGESSRLLAARPALVLSVWQDAKAMPTLAWMAGSVPGVEEVFAAARDAAQRIADEGVDLASAAGFDAGPLVVETGGPVWPAVLEVAEERDVAVIVMGSRGLSGVRSVMLGSVSNGVVHHATRPTLVIRRTGA
jgi:nucleotide-binding universal stress UspA family protein